MFSVALSAAKGLVSLVEINPFLEFTQRSASDEPAQDDCSSRKSPTVR